jgi:arylsulfatase A-like enzyme
MPMGKWNVYENDIRIPMVIRGPGIKPNSSFDHLASNVDVMPTILGLAGVERYDKGKVVERGGKRGTRRGRARVRALHCRGGRAQRSLALS